MATDTLLWDLSEVARQLGISKASAWRLHSGRKLPGLVQLPLIRAVRYDAHALTAWIAAGTPPREEFETAQPRELRCESAHGSRARPRVERLGAPHASRSPCI